MENAPPIQKMNVEPDHHAAGKPGPRVALTGARALWFGLGVLIAAIATTAAFFQPLRPDALRPPRTLRLQWWLHPVEANAFARIPRATQDPIRVFALPDGKHVWASGAGGLIVRSEDGGRTWSDTVLSGQVRPRAAAAAAAALGSGKSAIRLVGQKSPSQRQVQQDLRQQSEPADPLPEDTAPTRPNTQSGPQRIYPALTAICFSNEDHGWVAGTLGMLFHTTDGGQTWLQRRTLSDTDITDIACFPDLQTVWTLDSSGEVSLSSDAGEQWVVRTNAPLNSIAAVGSRLVGVSGDYAYWTTDGGQTWSGSELDAAPFLMTDVGFGTGRRGWAVGESGSLFVSDDAAASWRALANTPEFDYRAIAAIDSTTAVLSAGTVIVRTTDAFQTLQVDSSLYDRDGGIADLAFSDRDHGWAVHKGVHYTRDGGNTWTLQLAKSPIAALAFRDSLTGLAVGEHGLILATRDGGKTWKPRRTTFDRRLESVRFHGDTAWALPRYGPGLISLNRGRNWQAMAALADTGAVRMDSAATRWLFRSTRPVAWVAPLSPTNAFALAQDGNIVRSADAGQTWIEIDSVPRRWPAPWYYVALMLATTVSAVALRKRASPILQKSVADVLVSDRPWRAQSGDRDALGFRDVARGIAQFLANRRTQPPLTIAIIGAWGTGKTSLMSMLHHDLLERKFYPIWFNAWHHQREESLLAALFEGIKQQGIPPWWAPRGIIFRLKLLRMRVSRYPALASLAIALSVLGLGYFLSDPHARMEGLRRLSGVKTHHGENPSLWDQIKVILAVTSGVGAWVITYVNGIKPFKRKPSDLLTPLRGFVGLATRAGETGFRYAFAKDFKEVADALKPHPMVIFVDDLDRCRPEQVMEVLEAINFLQTCGDVVIVVGMDRERVIGCVGYAYKDVAADLVPGANPQADTDGDGVITPQEIRADFARQYLEKLINIEVPVPTATVDGLGRVMANRPMESAPEPDFEPDASRWVGRSIRWAQPLAIAASLALLFGIAYRSGLPTNAPVGDPPAVSTEFKSAGSPNAETPTYPNVSPTPSLTEPARFEMQRTAAVPPAVILLPIVLLMGVLVLALRNTSEAIVDDSDAFRDAMNLWGPLLFQRMSTPRSAKKFTNRVRFLAMLQRRPRPAASALQRFRVWADAHHYAALSDTLARFGISQPAEPAAPANVIPEDQLVTLSVIRECQPAWMDDDRLWNDFGSFIKDKKGQLPPQMAARFNELTRWGSLAHYRDRFTSLIRTVRVH